MFISCLLPGLSFVPETEEILEILDTVLPGISVVTKGWKIKSVPL